MKKVGEIEFLETRAGSSDAIREEIVVTGLTLFYCMVLRSNSMLSLFGAIFSRPGPQKAISEQILGHEHTEEQPDDKNRSSNTAVH